MQEQTEENYNMEMKITMCEDLVYDKGRIQINTGEHRLFNKVFDKLA